MVGGTGGQTDGRWAHPEALKAGETPGIRAAGTVFAVLMLGGAIIGTVLISDFWVRVLIYVIVALIAVLAAVMVLKVYGMLAEQKNYALHHAYHQNIEQERERQMTEFKKVNLK